jgi:hypothetical protein
MQTTHTMLCFPSGLPTPNRNLKLRAPAIFYSLVRVATHWLPDCSLSVLVGDEPSRQGTLRHAGQINLCNSDCNQNRAVIWNFGQLVTTPASQSAWWQVPARRFDSGGSGRSLPGAREHPMAFQWTKASRAKLSRSQKARWKERKRQQRRKGVKLPPDSVIGVVKIGLPSLAGSGALRDPRLA